MKPDLYTKAVLTVIALLLAVNALRPVLTPLTVHATGHTYMVAEVNENSGARVEDVLNKHSAEGWEPFTAYSLGNNWVGVIFKK